MSAPAAAVPGFYGKIPSSGDFVRRRLPRAFVDTWDRWLQSSISSSQAHLADFWLEGYLTSPLWRFALSPGLCGDSLSIGVLMPSVDSVGRYYPMTIAVLLPETLNPLDIADEADGWFCDAEQIALYCLDDGFVFEELESRLNALGRPASAANGSGAAAERTSVRCAEGLGWSIEPELMGRLRTTVYPGVLDGLLRLQHDPYSLWWTNGSDLVPSSFCIYAGLPPAKEFSSLLRGWQQQEEQR